MRALLCCLLALSVSPLAAAEPKIQRDVPYAGTQNARQTLDIYVPPEAKDQPIVFWIHGGGWQYGDKKEVDHKPEVFTDKKYIFISINYRLFPEVSLKEMTGDVAQALRWVHDHAGEFGGDPNNIVVTGHSAGAQLAALLCTDERYLKERGIPLTLIKGCIPVDGDTYDVPMQVAMVRMVKEERRLNSYLKKFGDDEASQKELSPITYVARGKGIPPVLILYVADHPETKAQSERLVKALRDAGVKAEGYAAQGTNHVALNADLGKPGDKPTEAMFEFFDKIMKARALDSSN